MNSEHAAGTPQGTWRSYLVAFVLSLLLTAIPFVLVMLSLLPASAAVIAVSVFAVSQIAVHLIFFLHLNRASEEPFKLTIFLYTLIILAILVGASIWIMHHLSAHYMVG
jgi:cytochrome o ubiquinol oxidase operon protein cyoD